MSWPMSRDCQSREVLSATHFVADLTLGLGEVVYDYLGPEAVAASDERAVAVEAAQ